MSASTNDGGPAFPVTAEQSPNGICTLPGMSLRDYFAAAALQGLLADPSNCNPYRRNAESAYLYADAMLAARAKEGQP